MTKAEARRIVRENMLDMMCALGISGWRIDVSYGTLDADDHDDNFSSIMSAQLRPRYEKAIVRIDPEVFDTEAEFLTSLRHELIHVLTAPFWSFSDDVLAVIPPLALMERRAYDQAYHNHWEALVLRVERMLDNGLGQTAKKLVLTARRRWSD